MHYYAQTPQHLPDTQAPTHVFGQPQLSDNTAWLEYTETAPVFLTTG